MFIFHDVFWNAAWSGISWNHMRATVMIVEYYACFPWKFFTLLVWKHEHRKRWSGHDAIAWGYALRKVLHTQNEDQVLFYQTWFFYQTWTWARRQWHQINYPAFPFSLPHSHCDYLIIHPVYQLSPVELACILPIQPCKLEWSVARPHITSPFVSVSQNSASLLTLCFVRLINWFDDLIDECF